ncbi:hypothetical protein [Daejeonella sp.]|uniref:anti-sigma factor family protein n=1 Tax=Daejeonella sp. TaxID=2805397 RepID=UPI0030BFAA11
MKIIEQEIWDYLDGSLSEDERISIESCIENDPLYRSIFEELSSLNDTLQTLELDHPSMSFNRNVMDKVDLEPNPGSIKSLIDKRIIYGISAFFILTIGGLLLFLFAAIDWSSVSDATNGTFTTTAINYSALSEGPFVKAFLFIDIMLGLLLLDGFLRKLVNTKKLKNI